MHHINHVIYGRYTPGASDKSPVISFISPCPTTTVCPSFLPDYTVLRLHLLRVFLFLAMLVSDAAGRFARRLTWSLTLAASAVLQALQKLACFQSYYSLHQYLPRSYLIYHIYGPATSYTLAYPRLIVNDPVINTTRWINCQRPIFDCQRPGDKILLSRFTSYVILISAHWRAIAPVQNVRNWPA